MIPSDCETLLRSIQFGRAASLRLLLFSLARLHFRATVEAGTWSHEHARIGSMFLYDIGPACWNHGECLDPCHWPDCRWWQGQIWMILMSRLHSQTSMSIYTSFSDFNQHRPASFNPKCCVFPKEHGGIWGSYRHMRYLYVRSLISAVRTCLMVLALCSSRWKCWVSSPVASCSWLWPALAHVAFHDWPVTQQGVLPRCERCRVLFCDWCVGNFETAQRRGASGMARLHASKPSFRQKVLQQLLTSYPAVCGQPSRQKVLQLLWWEAEKVLKPLEWQRLEKVALRQNTMWMRCVAHPRVSAHRLHGEHMVDDTTSAECFAWLPAPEAGGVRVVCL